MVDFVWWIWDPSLNLFSSALAVGVYYLIKLHPDTNPKFRRASYGIGLSIALISFVGLGLWMIPTVLLYITSVYSINHWTQKKDKRNK